MRVFCRRLGAAVMIAVTLFVFWFFAGMALGDGISVDGVSVAPAVALPDGVVTNGMVGPLRVGAMRVGANGNIGFGGEPEPDAGWPVSVTGSTRFNGWVYVGSAIFTDTYVYNANGFSFKALKNGNLVDAVSWDSQANVSVPNGNLTVAGTNTAAVLSAAGPVVLGPTLDGRRVQVFADGTNVCATGNTAVTNVLPVSRASVSNTVHSFWIGYEGEYIAETNATSGAVAGRVYMIRKP